MAWPHRHHHHRHRIKSDVNKSTTPYRIIINILVTVVTLDGRRFRSVPSSFTAHSSQFNTGSAEEAQKSGSNKTRRAISAKPTEINKNICIWKLFSRDINAKRAAAARRPEKSNRIAFYKYFVLFGGGGGDAMATRFTCVYHSAVNRNIFFFSHHRQRRPVSWLAFILCALIPRSSCIFAGAPMRASCTISFVGEEKKCRNNMFYGTWRNVYFLFCSFLRCFIRAPLVSIAATAAHRVFCMRCALRLFFVLSLFRFFFLCALGWVFLASFSNKTSGSRVWKRKFICETDKCVSLLALRYRRHEIHMVCLLWHVSSAIPVSNSFYFHQTPSLTQPVLGYELWHLRSAVYLLLAVSCAVCAPVAHDHISSLEYKHIMNEKENSICRAVRLCIFLGSFNAFVSEYWFRWYLPRSVCRVRGRRWVKTLEIWK